MKIKGDSLKPHPVERSLLLSAKNGSREHFGACSRSIGRDVVLSEKMVPKAPSGMALAHARDYWRKSAKPRSIGSGAPVK
jgi:hypothetical protein